VRFVFTYLFIYFIYLSLFLSFLSILNIKCLFFTKFTFNEVKSVIETLK